jgi:hypothetical protein
MKRRVMTSSTSAWLPKPTATPTTPAPASSGAMSVPICDSTISEVITTMTHKRAVRSSGSKVRTRVRRGASLASIALK